jgi:predicted dehydrogenase
MSAQKIRVGIIGVGCRGYNLLNEAICKRKNVEVVAVCDEYLDRAEKAAALVKELDGNEAAITTNYRDVLKMDNVDAVVISTAWEAHVQVSVDAMRAGKIVACEVGGAYSVDDCWQLVRTYEETGTPIMLLENCCYGQYELMVLNMVKKGFMGEVVHCRGGYHHDLREEVSFGRENRHYRLRNYMHRNGENYPTHELGPIAKVLNINRGNRMVSLTSTSSSAKGLNAYLMEKKGPDYDLTGFPFAQGDIVTTVIRCAHGETIVITLDTTLPRAYSRGFEVRGTKAAYFEDTNSVFEDGKHNEFDFEWKSQWNNAEGYREKFEHPIWKKFLNDGLRGGHGGMDGLVFDAFFEAITDNRPMPIDVYDMAAWMCITALSEDSIAKGSAPVAVPDFTGGRWCLRTEEPDWAFALSKICE